MERDLSYDDKLDIIIQGLSELTDRVDEIAERYDEIVEKLSNLTRSGLGFEIDELE